MKRKVEYHKFFSEPNMINFLNYIIHLLSPPKSPPPLPLPRPRLSRRPSAMSTRKVRSSSNTCQSKRLYLIS